jgi:NADH-quinone oxidoreductase subunit I
MYWLRAVCGCLPGGRHFVEAAENTDEERFSPVSVTPALMKSTVAVHFLRFFWRTALPTEAIVLGNDYELSFTDRRQSIFTKEMLLEPVVAGGKDTPKSLTLASSTGPFR